MTTRTEVVMKKQLVFAHGWIAWLSLLLALSRAAEDMWFWAGLWLGSALIWGGLATWEYRDYRRDA